MEPTPQLAALTTRMYDRLRRIASRMLADEPREEILQTTALVHEAYLRIRKIPALNDEAEVTSRQFCRYATNAMRRIVIDRARARRSRKRDHRRAGNEALQWVVGQPPPPPEQLIALDEAIEELRELDPELAEVTVSRVFGGLTLQEIATVLDRPKTAVHNAWRTSRPYLLRRLS